MLRVRKKSLHPKKHVQTTPTHFVLRRSLLVYVILVFVLFSTLAMSIYLIDRLVISKQHTDRLNQITAIYDSLGLDSSYRAVRSDLFGDKRVYSWDKGRTFASTIEYGHNDTPTNTASDLRKKVENAGFTYIQTEYEGSINPTQEYKNAKGNYLRVSTMSGTIHNSIVYGDVDSKAPLIQHANEAPTYVTIKVNLDDNNE